MVKVGLFGAGNLGKFHITKWQEIQDASLVGFYDPNEETAKEICDLYNLKRYYNEEELINDCDAIDVASPTPLHFSICETAIRKGKHVFIEKTMAHSLEEAQQLVKLVQESNIKLQVGQVERFNPAFLAARELDLHPMLIEAHRLAAFAHNSVESNVIMDVMIHDIDAVLSIVNSDVKHISATGIPVLTESSDVANVRIEFNNGCVANLVASRIATQEIRKMRLFQKGAFIDIDYLNKSTSLFKMNGTEDFPGHESDMETSNSIRTFVLYTPKTYEESATKLELQEFMKAIENNTRPVVNEIDGLRTMEVTHQILEKINYNISSK